MKRHRVMLPWSRGLCSGLALVACLVTPLGGQAPVDFSGTWAVEYPPVGGTAAVPGTPAAAASPGDMGSGWGPSLTMTQDGARLRLDVAMYSRYDLQPPLTYVYPFDGAEARTVVMVGRGEQVETSRARWDGATFVIVTRLTVDDPAAGAPFKFEVTRRLSLESPTTLVVEATRPGVLGGKPTMSRAVYRKR